MTFMWMVGFAMFPAVVSAADVCKDSKTTPDMNQCLSGPDYSRGEGTCQVPRGKQASSRKRLSNLAEFEKAQKARVAFRDAHWGAIYQYWAQGSVRGAIAGSCFLRLTRRRTHDLLDADLTYVDTTPPILPEPKLSENDK